MGKQSRYTWIAPLTLILLAISLLLAACGGPTPTEPPPTEAPTEEPTEAPTEAPTEPPTEEPTEEAPALSGTLTFMTWGGAYTEADVAAFLEPFSEEYGIEYQTVDAPAEMQAKLQAMADAGEVTIDVMDTGAATAYQLVPMGLLRPLPEDVRADLVAYCGEEGVDEYGPIHSLYANVIACNADAIDTCPTTAEEFFDLENFPGRRTMYMDGGVENLIFALLADGVSRDELYPLDYDRAYAKLDTIKDSIVWNTSGDQSQQVLRDEEVVAGYLWDGRAWGLVDQGVNMVISYDGASYASDRLVIPQDNPNPEAAYAYLRWYVAHPEAQAKWMEMIKYGTCNPEAYDLLEPEIAERLVGSHFDEVVPVDYAEYRPEVNERWYSWLGE